MTPKLTEDQRKALQNRPGTPVYVIDETTNVRYVLVPDSAYQRVRALLEDESFNVRETYRAQDTVAKAAGWDDAEMDVYDDYDKQQS